MDTSTPSHSLSSEYDFIVIGGGTAGLVVAARLVEDPNVQVLVVEAGDDHSNDPRVTIPAMWPSLSGSELDWKLVSTPQENLKGRTLKLPQGRALGGSSAINSEVFIPPSAATIDAWGKMGNSGWDWSTLAPYYRKSHTLILPDKDTCKHLGLDWVDRQVQGSSGPIQVSFVGVVQDPLSNAWVDTFKTLGHNVTRDPFSGKAMGGYSNPSSVDPRSKSRSYAVSAYIVPVRKQSNLHVVTNTIVKRLVLETTNTGVNARGVDVIYQGKPISVTARKEVILAAGVFQSPKLLELSGIGDPGFLNSLGIPVVIGNSGVGENLQDHLMTGISFEVKDGIVTGDPLLRQEQAAIQAAMQMYTDHKAGPFCAGGIGSHAFMPVVDIPSEDGQKAQEFLFKKYHPKEPHQPFYSFIRSLLEDPNEGSGALLMFLAQLNLHNDPDAKSYLQDLQVGNFLSLGALQTHSFSRGSVHIASADATDAPKIDSRYLFHPLDIEIYARHLLFLERLAQTQPLASFLKPGGRRNHPTAHIKDLDEAKDYIRTTAISASHHSGTCAMMPREKGGVVNERLLVHGTMNLRVVDASIMPLIPRGNLQTTVYAVAERAADIIKTDHHLRM
ncbi:GMC oxidoreductase [Oidiodendron maius Zn]|uniref:GMC oxidoreductase n=1 Tax=Oidiodendron maius (strain Zn) TaxID=913774 RepID=A0A0C3G8X8_OIDMZ|nr:GMC oxidoreductase [Oidiodendron maius Zn]